MTPIAEQAGRYIDAGDINSALDAIQEAEASGESAAVLHYLRGRICVCRKDWEAGYQHLKEFVHVHPEHIDGAAKFADMCFMTERFAEALPHYHKVVARYPDMVQMWKNLSACYSKLEQFREALSCVLKVQALEAGAHLNESSVLRQRDWLLNTQNALSRLGPQRIERRHKLSGDEFRNGYYSASKPVIITGRLDNWPALKLWSLQYFKDRFGNQEVEVQANRASDPLFGGFDPSLKRKMLCADVMDEMAKPSSDLYMVGTNAEANSSILRQISGDVRNVDEYLLDGDDFWSLWLGPAGTFTSAHYDPIDGLLAQVTGRKRVWMAPACAAPNVYNHVGVFSQVDFRRVDYDRFPLMRNVGIIECEIGPGDLLFIPIGWWHAVESLDVSASVRFGHVKWNTHFETPHPPLRPPS